MRIKTKMTLFNMGALLLLGVSFMGVTLHFGEQQERRETAYLRTVLMEEKKTQLNDLMANAYSAVQSAHFWTDGQRALHNMRFGPEGKNYYFVLDREGVFYVHPERPELVGKKSPDLEDADGGKFIREIMKIADEKGEGLIEYRWPDPEAGMPHRKLAAVKLYKEWNWIICAGIDMNDIEKAVALKASELTENTYRNLSTQGAIMGILLTAILMISRFFNRRISSPIEGSVRGIGDVSRQVASASERVLSSSIDVAANTAAQAATIKKVMSALEKIVSGARGNMEKTDAIESLREKALALLERTDCSLTSLGTSMTGISEASEQVSRVVGLINDLSFKIRLVALNASVEAARAGETGKGFAVIADEIRAMADQSAAAGKSTEALIVAALDKIDAGAQQTAASRQQFAETKEGMGEIASLLQGIAASSERQEREIAEIHESIAVLEMTTDTNTVLAGESATTARVMAGSAQQMDEVVAELVTVIGEKPPTESPKSRASGFLPLSSSKLCANA